MTSAYRIKPHDLVKKATQPLAFDVTQKLTGFRKSKEERVLGAAVIKFTEIINELSQPENHRKKYESWTKEGGEVDKVLTNSINFLRQRLHLMHKESARKMEKFTSGRQKKLGLNEKIKSRTNSSATNQTKETTIGKENFRRLKYALKVLQSFLFGRIDELRKLPKAPRSLERTKPKQDSEKTGK